MPSTPPCPCGTSSSDPLHVVIRGRPLRSSANWWELGGSGGCTLEPANGNSSTCPIVSGVGGTGPEQTSVAGFIQPSQPILLSPSSASLQARHYCLPWQAATGRGPSAGVCATCQGTSGPSDLPPEILSLFTQAMTFMTYVNTIN